MSTKRHYEVIVLGAGVQGLRTAHTFLSINPNLDLLIIDDKASIGGVWSKEQLYPDLRTNNRQGLFEFSDFSMLEAGLEDFGVTRGSVIEGPAFHQYLLKYAERFDLLRRIRLNTKAIRARLVETRTHIWSLDVRTAVNDEAKQSLGEAPFTCSILIVATGATSKPLMPHLNGLGNFSKPVVHTSELGNTGRPALDNEKLDHVTVIGGSKSAYDSVYMFAKGKKKVTWLLRPEGRGGLPMARPYISLGPFSIWLEGLLMLRMLSWFGACPWAAKDIFPWARWALHGTPVGRWIVKSFFANMSLTSFQQSGIFDDASTKSLVPKETLLWYGTQAGILNYDDDFYKLIKSCNVEIIGKNIDRLAQDRVLLEKGTSFRTDMIICATGYDYGCSVAFELDDDIVTWGIPVSPLADNTFPKLDARADRELFRSFPMLSQSPKQLERQPGLTPWRLWRFIAPPSQVCSSQRSLAFLCATASYQTMLKCEISSLWTYAYLFGKLDKQTGSEDDVMYEAALWSRFGKWNRPMGMQGKIADFLLDAMPYYDLLLQDLGLNSWRRGGWWADVFGTWYSLKDYQGLVNEWKQKQGQKEKQEGE